MSIFGKYSIEKLKLSQLNQAKTKLDGDNLDVFYIIFFIIYVDEITVYLMEWIDSFESNGEFNFHDFEIPDKFRFFTRSNKITLLSRLFYTENKIPGLKLAIDLILKNPSLTGEILYSIKEDFLINCIV